MKIIIYNSIFMALTLFSTSLKSQTYCSSKGNLPWEHWIERVSLSSNNFSNPSIKEGYGNFTALTGMTAQRQQTSLFTISPQASWLNDPQNNQIFWRVWIDYNGDGDFTDADEQVISRQVVFTSGIFLDNETTFTVPITARLGNTRLRVAMKVGGYPMPCENFDMGEVEDYTIQITEGGQTGGGYCASKGVAPWELWISNVQLNTINNASDKFKDYNTLGYSNYTNLSTTIAKNRPYQLTVNPSLSWVGNLSNVYCRVWVDYNGNNTYESTELVFQGTNMNSFSGNIIVPATAIDGTVRMRVAVKWGSYPEPCETFERGEVEDYTINLQGISVKWINAAVQNWLVPQNATIGQTQNSTFDLTSNGTLPLSNVLVGAFLSSDSLWGSNDVLIGNITSPPIGIQTLVGQVLPFTIPANTLAGNYFIILKADYTDLLTEIDETDNTIIKPFVVQTGGTNYCDSRGIAPWELWISKVQFETINNASDKFKDFKTLGYSDYSNISTTITRGMTSVLTVTPELSWSGNLPNVYCRAWIDYNGNKIFEPSELVFQNTNITPFVAAIRIPNAPAITARMRVAVKWGSYPEPCETFGRGEVEDYTLNFQTGGAIINSPILELEAHATLDNAQLIWLSNQSDVAYFEIYKANKQDVLDVRDAVTHHFQKIGVQKSVEKDNLQSYFFNETSNAEGSYFYQIKAIKYNGMVQMSAIKEVKINDFSGEKVFPNPASDEVSILLKYDDNAESKVFFYNILGVVVKTLSPSKSNTTLIKTEVSDLPTGQYYVRIVAKGKRDVVHRFVIVR